MEFVEPSVKMVQIDGLVSESLNFVIILVITGTGSFKLLYDYQCAVISVPYRVKNLRKMRHFWANFTDFEQEINILRCKTEKLKQKTSNQNQIFIILAALCRSM